MKLHEILTEDQLTEVILAEGIIGNIGTKIGQGVGAVARGIGAVAGGVAGAWDAAKQGFAKGRAVVSGTTATNVTRVTPTVSGRTASTTAANVTSVTPITQSTSAAPTATQQPSASTTPGLTTAQIRAAIPKLNVRDLKTLQKTLDILIQAKKNKKGGGVTVNVNASSASAAGGPATSTSGGAAPTTPKPRRPAQKKPAAATTAAPAATTTPVTENVIYSSRFAKKYNLRS